MYLAFKARPNLYIAVSTLGSNVFQLRRSHMFEAKQTLWCLHANINQYVIISSACNNGLATYVNIRQDAGTECEQKCRITYMTQSEDAVIYATNYIKCSIAHSSVKAKFLALAHATQTVDRLRITLRALEEMQQGSKMY